MGIEDGKGGLSERDIGLVQIAWNHLGVLDFGRCADSTGLLGTLDT